MKTLRAVQPTVVLIVLASLLIGLTSVARAISARAGFLVERPIVLLVWLAGLLIASAVFAWVARRSMRRDSSRSGLLLMMLTVLALASPFVLILLQHPAP